MAPQSAGPRVLMISFLSYPFEGGAEKQGRLLARVLRGLGAETGQVAARLPGMPAHEIRDGVPVERVLCFPWIKGLRSYIAAPVYMLALAAYLQRNADRWDVFHILGAFDLSVGPAAAMARRLGKRYVIKQASMNEYEIVSSSFLGAWRVRMARQADAHVGNSPAIYERMVNQLGLPPERCHFIPNGILLPDKVEKSAARARLGLDSARPLVLCVSRFVREKNQQALVRAWPEVLARYPQAQLLLAGDGPQMGLCQAEVQRLGLGESVRFLGRWQDVDLLLDAADLFAFASRTEGMPNVVMEAMAHALPCAVSAIPGNLALVSPGVDGLAFDLAHPPELAAVIIDLLSDPQRVQHYGEAARRKMGEQFSLEQMAGRYLELYRGLPGRGES